MTWIIGATAAAIVVGLLIWAVVDYLEHRCPSAGWSEEDMDEWEKWRKEGKE